MKTILLISPYWREPHRWMVSSYKLAELWQRLGYRVVVACMGSSTRVDNVSDTLTIHFRKDIFLKDPWNYGIAFRFSGFVNRLVKQEKPDIIVVNKLLFWSSLASIGLRLRGYRVIQLTDALVGMTWWPRGLLPKICAKMYAWTIGWLLLKIASRVIFFHPQPEKLLKKLRIEKKSEVIPTGIDLAQYASSSLRDDKKVTITYIGRLESVKGVDDFLAAVVPLKKEYPQLDIQVVGWHKKNHPLISPYQQDEAMLKMFKGLREDIPAILSATDIFVLPSHSEGLSNALMEAMASGCACIATEVGGNAFLIQNGISGFLYTPGDTSALAAHLRRVIQDPAKRRAMGEAARARIKEQFAWDVVGKSYHALFDGYLGAK